MEPNWPPDEVPFSEADFFAMVEEGIAQARRGEFIEEEEMDALFEKLL